MTTYNKAALKTYFEQGDIPTGQNYSDLIDSQVNIAETANQSMTGPLTATKFTAPRVSAANVNITGTMSAATAYMQNLAISGAFNVTGSAAFSGLLVGGQASITGFLSADGSMVTPQLQVTTALNVTGSAYFNNAVFRQGVQCSADVSAAHSVYASAMRSVNGVFVGVGIVSAAGTAQATAALLTSILNRGKGVVDGSTTGFAIPANRIGLTQIIYNDAASANLYPPTGGTINALGANAPFPMAASIPYTIYHLTVSAYAVK